MLLRMAAENRVYNRCRPNGCTVIVLSIDEWPGNEFCLWLPESIFYNSNEVMWGNWNDDAFQEWQESGEALVWRRSFEHFDIESSITVDQENLIVQYQHYFTNKSDFMLQGLNTQTCFHLVNAPEFISIRGERLWACIDGEWITTDGVSRELSPDPRRVVFLRTCERKERTAVALPGLPRAIMPEQAYHPLFIAENHDANKSVGIASKNFYKLYNNNEPLLRCIHSDTLPIEQLSSGETKKNRRAVSCFVTVTTRNYLRNLKRTY